MTTTLPMPPKVSAVVQDLYDTIRRNLSSISTLPPRHYLFTNGKVLVLPLQMANEAEKDMSAALIRQANTAVKPDFTITLSEVYMVKVDDGKVPEQRPSQHPERIEAVALSVAWRGGASLVIGEIRQLAGNARYIDEDPEVITGVTDGRFSQPLP